MNKCVSFVIYTALRHRYHADIYAKPQVSSYLYLKYCFLTLQIYYIHREIVC